MIGPSAYQTLPPWLLLHRTGEDSSVPSTESANWMLVQQGHGQMPPLIAQSPEPACTKTDWICAYAFPILLPSIQPYRLTVLSLQACTDAMDMAA